MIGQPATSILRRRNLFAVLFLIGTLAAGAVGEEPGSRPIGLSGKGAKQASRKDIHGDTLPAGAIARLGTVRFRKGFLAYQAVVSADGKKIAAVGAGMGVCVWDAVTGKELLHLPKPSQQISVAISPDGKLLACMALAESPPWQVALVDAATGKVVHRLGVANPRAFVFSQDGKKLAFFDTSGSAIELRDTTTGQPLQQIKTPKAYVGRLAFSPDGTILAGANINDEAKDNRVHLWDTATGKELPPLIGHEKAPSPLAFSPDGKVLATGGTDDTIRFWDVASGKQLRASKLKSGTIDLAFSPDGRTLATGHSDGMILLWDAATGREVRRWQAHAFGIQSLTFTPDGGTIVSTAAWESGPRFWDITGKESKPLDGHHSLVDWLAYAPDGKLLSISRDRTLLDWDLSSSRPRKLLHWPVAGMAGFSLSPDRKTLATISFADGVLQLWDVATGKEKRTLAKYGKSQKGFRQLTVCFSPDGKHLACSSADAIHFWDLSAGKELRSFGKPGGRAYMSFSPDGTVLAWSPSGAQGEEQTIHFQDTANGANLRTIEVDGQVGALAFAPDGRYVASAGGWNSPVQVWDLITGKQHSLKSPSGAYSVVFSPDLRYLATGGMDNDPRTRIFELLTGKEVCRFDGQDAAVLALDFSADGRTLATGGGNSSILIWDVSGGQLAGGPRPASLSNQELEAAWKDLADDDAARAHRALWLLTATPRPAVSLLQDRLRPVPPVAADRVSALVAALDSPRFPARQKAAAELTKLGEGALPALRQAVKKAGSLESQQRLNKTIKALTSLEPEQRQTLRAVTVLEQIGTAEARQILQVLAGGVAGARLTQEAKRSLARLSGRPLAVPVRDLLAGWQPDPPFRYPEARHTQGELKYVNGLPVLTVAGTPEEIGEQIGVLALRPMLDALDAERFLSQMVQAHGGEKKLAWFKQVAKLLLLRFPKEARAELDAMSKASGLDRELLVLGNLLPDAGLFGCSTLLVGPERSTTGKPLFGRNLDIPPRAGLERFSLVMVYRPKGKRPFASAGFPGILIGPSVMNDAGLSFAVNSIYSAADNSPRFNPLGTPQVVWLRRLAEECSDRASAEKLLRSFTRTGMLSLSVCDKNGGDVFEITTKSLVVRSGVKGLCACTNHFLSKELAMPSFCGRYPQLEKRQKLPRLGVKHIAQALDAVHQGRWTVQSMVFEPADLKLHLAIGKGPTSALPLREIDLGPLLRKETGVRRRREQERTDED